MRRKVLYNLLRMNWLSDPKIDVKSWQVEDYRELENSELFSRLAELDIQLDYDSFLTYAEDFEDPEELSDALTEEFESAEEQDQIFLLIFEAWRRFAHEKICLSVFCDELDQKIYLYDHDAIEDLEQIEDILANLEAVLDENVDQGGDPQEVFAMISDECANDIEAFLYDFIDNQINNNNLSYASDLLDGFSEYTDDDRWFRLLQIRIEEVRDPIEAVRLFEEIVEDCISDSDLALSFELLEQLQIAGRREQFLAVVKSAIPLLETEEDFQELLRLSSGFFERLDAEKSQKRLESILQKRSDIPRDNRFKNNDTDIKELVTILAQSNSSSTS